MKKTLIFLIFISACTAYSQTADKEILNTLNQKISEAYKEKKFDEALSYSKQSLEINLKIFGADHNETAVAFTNLGIIFREKQKYKDSIQNFQNALDIYKKNPSKYSNNITRMYDVLAEIQFLSGNEKEAEANALSSLKIKEEAFGKESKEVFYSNLFLAELYSQLKNKKSADEYYLNSYIVGIKLFGKTGNEIERIDDSRACSGISYKSKDEEFNDAKKKLFGYDQGNFVDGKAISLAKPHYPVAARAKRAGGLVVIKILIDEQGIPTQAKAVCGHPLLQPTSEEAALKSKFTPTIKDGKPIKMKGYVHYNYVPN